MNHTIDYRKDKIKLKNSNTLNPTAVDLLSKVALGQKVDPSELKNVFSDILPSNSMTAAQSRAIESAKSNAARLVNSVNNLRAAGVGNDVLVSDIFPVVAAIFTNSVAASAPVAGVARRGRPAGSKNQVKADSDNSSETPKRRGRPAGSKNKATVETSSEANTETPKRRGRPAGSKNQATVEATAQSQSTEGQSAPKRRGRPAKVQETPETAKAETSASKTSSKSGAKRSTGKGRTKAAKSSGTVETNVVSNDVQFTEPQTTEKKNKSNEQKSSKPDLSGLQKSVDSATAPASA